VRIEGEKGKEEEGDFFPTSMHPEYAPFPVIPFPAGASEIPLVNERAIVRVALTFPTGFPFFE